ncbi:cAMP-mediated signaling protein sok1, partial [Tieghemiomyces parasiticus]
MVATGSHPGSSECGCNPTIRPSATGMSVASILTTSQSPRPNIHHNPSASSSSPTGGRSVTRHLRSSPTPQGRPSPSSLMFHTSSSSVSLATIPALSIIAGSDECSSAGSFSSLPSSPLPLSLILSSTPAGGFRLSEPRCETLSAATSPYRPRGTVRISSRYGRDLWQRFFQATSSASAATGPSPITRSLNSRTDASSSSRSGRGDTHSRAGTLRVYRYSGYRSHIMVLTARPSAKSARMAKHRNKPASHKAFCYLIAPRLFTPVLFHAEHSLLERARRRRQRTSVGVDGGGRNHALQVTALTKAMRRHAAHRASALPSTFTATPHLPHSTQWVASNSCPVSSPGVGSAGRGGGRGVMMDITESHRRQERFTPSSHRRHPVLKSTTTTPGPKGLCLDISNYRFQPPANSYLDNSLNPTDFSTASSTLVQLGSRRAQSTSPTATATNLASSVDQSARVTAATVRTTHKRCVSALFTDAHQVIGLVPKVARLHRVSANPGKLARIRSNSTLSTSSAAVHPTGTTASTDMDEDTCHPSAVATAASTVTPPACGAVDEDHQVQRPGTAGLAVTTPRPTESSADTSAAVATHPTAATTTTSVSAAGQARLPTNLVPLRRAVSRLPGPLASSGSAGPTTSITCPPPTVKPAPRGNSLLAHDQTTVFPHPRQYRPHPPGLALSSPSLIPPINRFTLRELGLPQMLNNIQLRHDIVLESNLEFRPNNFGDAGRQKEREAADYWHSVDIELRNLKYLMNTATGRQAASTSPARPLASKTTLSLSTSKITFLISEVREIMSEMLTPNDTQLREELMANLDVKLIHQQLQHGVFNVVNVVNYITTVLKRHCAPVRDALIESILRSVHRGEYGRTLRRCFELLEVMRLDLANHQIRTMRTQLIAQAPQFELSYISSVISSGGMSISRTKAWWKAQLLADAKQALAQGAAIDRPVNRLAVFLTGFVHLVATDSRTWADRVPETFYLDNLRLNQFRGEWHNVYVMGIILLIYRQAVTTILRPPAAPANGRRSPSPAELDAHILQVKGDLWSLLSPSASPSDCTRAATTLTTDVPNKSWSSAAKSPAGLLGRHLHFDLNNGPVLAPRHNNNLKLGPSALPPVTFDHLVELLLKSAATLRGEPVTLVQRRTFTSLLQGALVFNSRIFTLVQSRITRALASALQHASFNKDFPTKPMLTNTTMAFRTANVATAVGSSSVANYHGQRVIPATEVRRTSAAARDLDSETGGGELTTSATPKKNGRVNSATAATTAPVLPAEFIEQVTAHGIKALTPELVNLSQKMHRVASHHWKVFRGLYTSYTPSALARVDVKTSPVLP